MDKASEAVSSVTSAKPLNLFIQTYLHPQSSTQAPTVVGLSFAADVVRRYRQYIIVLRETVSSYTLSSLIDGERHDQLRNALLSMCAELRFNDITTELLSLPPLQKPL